MGYDVAVENGEIKILGLPTGARIASYNSRFSHQLKKIRVSESLLKEARQALKEWPKYGSTPIVQGSLVAFAVGNYFACFAKNNDTCFKLDAKEIFRGNKEAYARHQDWRRFRDQYYHHLGPVGRSFAYGLALSEDNEFIDGVCVGMTNPVGQNRPWIQILFQLIDVALKALDVKAEVHFQKVKNEIAELSEAKIKALPKLHMNKPKLG